jgi:amino acid adenylation domain-containing protein/non-ribosomal peptide synthase protein (TIGR01720 family)
MDYALWYYEQSFPRTEVAHLAEAFEAALLGVVRQENTRVRDIALVGPDHLKWLHSRNEVLPEAKKECIHDAISHFVVATPLAPAVCAWDGNFSYGELGRLASLLTGVLVQRGVQSEVLVAIHLAKSRWTAVAMLAVLQAGGAFTLLDPSLPLAHKQVICDETACLVLITSPASHHALPSVRHTIPVGDNQEDDWVTVSTREAGECLEAARPETLAYAVFTSGSMGKPKGVLIEHGSFCASARSQHRLLAIDSTTRVLQFSAYSWDVSIMDQLGTFMAGGCVCVPSESQRIDELAGAIRQYAATWIQTTPPVVRLLKPDQVPSLQTVVLIGETPSHDDVKTWRGRVSLRETYGPTECSVLAMVNADLAGDPRNIGRESACVCWVVDADDNGKLMPVGAIGELLIEGPILGRGYLKDAALTASVFVQDPVWALQRPGPGPVRLYKTGDLAHYCHDGSIRYVRRKDTQVKLRGQRMEPGEIQHHIAGSFEGAERVVVDVVEVGGGTEASRAVLAAFIKESDSGSHSNSNAVAHPSLDVLAAPIGAFAAKVAQCQTYLETQLPKHMVPTLFLPLAWVPMASTGKTDRRLLRRRVAELSRDDVAQYLATGLSTAVAKQAPTTDAERMLRDAWSRVLGIPADAIGIHESFFHLGGDSMSGMRLVADCYAAGVVITMQGIFQHPTLQQMAQHSKIDYMYHGHKGHAAHAFPLSKAQRSLLESCLSTNGAQHYRSFVVKSSRSDLDADWLGRAMRVLVSRHAMLRARFEPVGPGQDIWQQRITSEIEGSYRVRGKSVPISNKGEVDLERQRGPSRLDFNKGPLLEACLLQSQPGGHLNHRNYIVLFCHPIVVDRASCSILADDMVAMLEQDAPTAVQDPAPAAFQTWCSLPRNKIHLSPNMNPNCDSRITANGINGDNGDVARTCREARLDVPTSRLIREDANRAFSTQPLDILHAALHHSFFQTFGLLENHPIICAQGDGRDLGDAALDLSHAVGCFDTFSAVQPDANHLHSLVGLVRLAKDARRLPRMNQADADQCSATALDGESSVPGPLIVALSFEAWGDHMQQDHNPAVHMEFAPIEVSCRVDHQGELVVSFMYKGQTHNDELMAEWLSKYQKSLASAATELASRAPAYTLSDFSLLQLTYKTLDSFVAEVEDLARSQGSQGLIAIEDAYPCAPIQRGILLSQSKNGLLYRPRFSWRLHATRAATIELPRLRKAWETVLQRHAIFRTVFTQEGSARDGFYSQAILRSTPKNITEIQCDDGDDPATLIRSVQSRHEHEAWHVVLCQTKKTRDTFCELQVNHALIDGASIGIVASEVQRVYAGVGPIGGGPRYRGYIEYLQSTPSDTIVAHWKERLSGVSPSLFPKICGTREDTSLEQNERVLRSVDVELEDASLINQFCARHELNVSTVMYVAWALVLRSYTQSDEACFAYTTSGRDVPVPGAAEAVGPFINVLIGRVQLPAETRLLDVLRTVQDDTLDNLNYQNCSLAEIGHAIAVDTAELFNSSISVQDSTPHQDSSDLPVVFTSEGGADPTEYALSLHALVNKQTVELSIDYWEGECLSSEQADQIIHTFRQAINTVVTQPRATVAQANLLSPKDANLIKQWNLNTPPRHERCVHHLVEEHFQDSASSLAVHSWDGDLTYGELDHLSGQLAAHLVELGAQPETYIPLVFEKSKWTVVAMMAVMRAGAAFVLMDPTTPVLRLEDICTDAQPALVLASVTHRDVLQHLSVHTIVVGPTSETTWPTQPPPAVRVQPSNPVYAVFTSGSTGKPKGVIMDHASCCSTLEANKGPMGVDRNTRTFQFSNYSFDLSVSDHLLALTQGGCVCIPSAAQLHDIEQAIQDVGANWVELTPSVARLISPSHVPALRTVNLGGEPMAVTDSAQWRGYARLVNTYGPAECGSWCMAQPDVTVRLGPPDIGVGTGAVCWIVDPADHQTLLPVGAVGEILLEGPAVSRGYLRRPEQTEASFVQPPAWVARFRPAASHRFYKTGDLARYQPDGTMLHMGRKDTQVKLRGQRLELDEVAFHVRQCLPKHADAVVDLIHPNGGGARPMLAAFIYAPDVGNSRGVPQTQAKDNDNVLMPATAAFQRIALEIQTQLRVALPRFMVPTAFLPLRWVPLGVTGKLDRKCLRALAAQMTLDALLQAYDAEAMTPSVDKARPANDLEASLLECIAHVLNIKPEEVGINDNFFHLGGDSIGAMELVTRCRHQGLTITMPDIFRHRSIHRMARRAKRVGTGASAVKGEEEEVGVQFGLSPIQQAFFDRVPEGRLRYNQSFMVELQSSTQQPIETAISMVVRRHAMLRTSFRRSEAGLWMQTITDRIDQSFRYMYHSASVSRAELSEELKHHLEESQAVVDCQNGPMLAVDHILVDDGRQYLSLIAHHLAVDLVSWRVIMSDLEVLLEGESLPPLHCLSFPSWCHAQSEHVRTNLKPLETLPSLENLDDFEADVENFWGCPQTTNTHAEAISASFTLDSTTTTLLLGPANEALRTKPIELIHAAILLSFAQVFPGRRPPIIHQEGHGRESWNKSVDVSETVGWFTTLFPVLVPVASDTGLVDVVRRTKDALRQTPANGWSYFAARYLHPEGHHLLDLKRPAEILLNYHGTYRSLEREGNILQSTSRFDGLSISTDPQMPRDAFFVIEAWVSAGSMQFQFTYNRNCLHQDLVCEWLTTCQALLGAVAEELSSAPHQITSGDFPRLGLTQQEMDMLLQHVAHLSIAPSCLQDAYPCSHMQQGILLSQARNEALYETTTRWKMTSHGIDNHLTAGRIEAAWELVVAKYAALRTIIIESPSSHRSYDQIVLECDNITGNITTTSFSGPQAEKQGPLPWSFVLTQTSDAGDFECALTISHALVDGRSLQLLSAELAAAVNGSALGGGPEPLQYGEYISYLSDEAPREEDTDCYWRQYLHDATPCRFPKLSGGPSSRGQGQLHSATRQIPSGRLQRLCEEYGTTPSNVIQVAWALVLRCYVGSDDVCFGYLASGRDIALPGIEDAVGLFINMLVCRLRLDDESLPVVALLERNQESFVRGLENQHCSMARIQHDLDLRGDVLFNSIISYQARSGAGDDAVASDLDGRKDSGHAARLETVDIDDPTEVRICFAFGFGRTVNLANKALNFSMV